MKHLLFIAFLLWVSPGWAATIHVDSDGISCSSPSDTTYDPATTTCGGGGSDTVYDTIQGAVTAAAAGDNVSIHAGTYSENVTTNNPGTMSSPITIDNYLSDVVTHKGVGTTTSDVTMRIEDSYITVSDITFEDGHMGILAIGTTAANLTGIIIKDCTVKKGHIAGIRFWKTDNSSVTNCEVTDNVQFNSPRGTGTPWGNGIGAFVGSENNVFENNTIHFNHGEGFVSVEGSNNNVFRNNTVYDNWSVNVYVHDSKDVTIENNYIYLTQAVQDHAFGSQTAVSDPTLIVDPTGIIIRNNIVFDTAVGIRTFSGNPGAGKFAFSDATVQNNILVYNDSSFYWEGDTTKLIE